jgi:hypothetical protein
MLLRGIQLSLARDEVVWEQEKSGRYTTKCLYRFLSFGGIKCSTLNEIWQCGVPPDDPNISMDGLS